MTGRWVRTKDRLPPSGWQGQVITPDGDQRELAFDRMWWLPDRSMYVYFTPERWLELPEPTPTRSRP